MPMSYRVDPVRDLLVGEASGELTADEIIEAFDKAVEDSDGAALHMSHLFLIDENTSLHWLDIAGLTRIKDTVEAWVRLYGARNVCAAFVASTDLQAAFVKMWQALAVANPAVGAHVRPFTSQEAALEWLTAETG
jgi:hypothetical protein